MTSVIGYVTPSPISVREGPVRSPNLYVDVEVSTNPIVVDFQAGQTIEVRCRVRAYLTINDYLYISFYVSVYFVIICRWKETTNGTGQNVNLNFCEYASHLLKVGSQFDGHHQHLMYNYLQIREN